MIRTEETPAAIGADVLDPNGQKIGQVDEIFVDDTSGQPEWLRLSTGFMGMKERYAPCESAQIAADGIHVPFTKDQVKEAPAVQTDSEGLLPADQEQQLYQYYGTTHRAPGGTESPKATGGTARSRSDTTAAAPTSDASMTRSEERMRVGMRQTETGKVRLRKYVVTEQVQQTVPVRREEVRIEREPITGGSTDQRLEEGEQEITLHEERPVVTTETVPVETVKMGKETRTEQEQVTGQVRGERIDVEEDQPRNKRR